MPSMRANSALEEQSTHWKTATQCISDGTIVRTCTGQMEHIAELVLHAEQYEQLELAL